MRKLKSPIIVEGKVIPGEKVGKTIGFPTANLRISSQRLKIKKGVYFSTCLISNQKYFGLTYFGPRYIFNQLKSSFEVYIYNFSENIYGKVVKAKLTHFIRSPAKIKSLNALKKLLTKDKEIGTKLITKLQTNASAGPFQ